MKKSTAAESRNNPAGKTEAMYLPELENAIPVEGKKLDNYLKELQKHFISGEKTEESLMPDVYPIKYARQLKGDDPFTGFPFFFDSDNDDVLRLYPFLEKLVDEQFDEESSAIIREALPEIFASIEEKLKEAGSELVVQSQIDEFTKALATIDTPQKDTDEFELKINTIREELLKHIYMLLDCTGITAFKILNLQYKWHSHLKAGFLKTLKEVITGINELLMLHSDESNQSMGQLGFAEDLIAFDKIRDIAVSSVSSHLPASRLKRLRSALQTLLAAQKNYTSSGLTIFTSEAIMKAFDLKSIFSDAPIIVASGNTCAEASKQFQKDMDEFVQTVAALKVGRRMMDQKYEEHLHDPYFDHFDWTFLSDEELNYLPPILVIEDSQQLMRHSNDFLALLSHKSLVKILGVNTLDDLYSTVTPDDLNYLELASLAIFRRTSYVFQGGVASPSTLHEAYKKGLDFPGSAFWNILIPGRERKGHTDFFALNAAMESRFFPNIEYEVRGSNFVNNQISLQNNPAPDAYSTTYEQKIKLQSGIETKDLGFTVAEFLALDAESRATLEIIPPVYQSPNYIPLNEHLSQPKDLVPGKIPFVWLVDDQYKLRRAAVPVSWIKKCRNRREYWRFLQSISGTNNAQLEATIEQVKLDWEEAKHTEVEALETALRTQYEKERAGYLEAAISRMLYGLLNEEDGIENVLRKISKEELEPSVEVRQEQEPVADKQVEKKEEEAITIVKEEAWVESDECTSCRDCVDALPSVFKYNENKQAYVHNPKGGTYAEIVKAAEKCPARCIHPGVPQNKNEESLEKWIKRAEKFN